MDKVYYKQKCWEVISGPEERKSKLYYDLKILADDTKETVEQSKLKMAQPGPFNPKSGKKKKKVVA